MLSPRRVSVGKIKDATGSEAWGDRLRAGLERYLVAPIPSAEAINDPRYAINKTLTLKLIKGSLDRKKIDTYQASMLLSSVMCFGSSSQTKRHLFDLIHTHNDSDISKTEKINLYLTHALEGGLTYDELRKTGLVADPNYPFGEKRPTDILYKTFNQETADFYPASEENGEGYPEEEKGTFDLRGRRRNTYSAVPKDIVFNVLKEAMGSGTMDYMQLCMVMAINCHSLARRDKGKERYIDHVMAVAADLALTDDQRFIALIHDVWEDSNYTFEDFKSMRMPTHIIRAIESISKQDDESYFRFIMRCSLNPDGRAVKMADLRHNMRDASAHTSLKYHVCHAYLEAVEAGKIEPGTDLLGWVKNKPYLLAKVDQFVDYIKDRREEKDIFELTMLKLNFSDVYGEMHIPPVKEKKKGTAPGVTIQQQVCESLPALS